MGKVQWIKLYKDMFDKHKIKKLRRLPAGKCNAGGHQDKVKGGDT